MYEKMDVCMYVWKNVSKYVCMKKWMYVCMYEKMYVSMYVWKNGCMYVCIKKCM